MGSLVQFAFNFETVECINCGTVFAMTSVRYRKSQDEGKNFYCPNGHSLVFTDTENAKLKREIEKEKQRREWAEKSRDEAREQRDRQERRAIAFKGVATRTKKRVGNGVCPCCNRTFQNVMAHMKTQHPTYKGKEKS